MQIPVDRAITALSSWICNIVLLRWPLTWFKRRVETLELDACISSGKAPVDRDGLLIARVLPGVDLALQLLLCANAARETLARQSGKFNLGHIQPTAMYWGVMDF